MSQNQLFVDINESSSEVIVGGGGRRGDRDNSFGVAFASGYQEATVLAIGDGAFAGVGGLLIAVASVG